MKNISREDFIIWNNKTNAPLEDLDTVYHYTTLVELINDKFMLGDDKEFRCVAELPLSWQRKINEAIEGAK